MPTLSEQQRARTPRTTAPTRILHYYTPIDSPQAVCGYRRTSAPPPASAGQAVGERCVVCLDLMPGC